MFTLQRPEPPADLALVIEQHWLVAWDLRGRPDYTSEVLPHPCVHMVLEPGGGSVYGVTRERYMRRLSGAGWALGTKFQPGGFEPFSGCPVSELTDRVLGFEQVFGAAGQRLQRRCLALEDPAQALGLVQTFLRERLPAATSSDPNLRLVKALAMSMAQAEPGTRVSSIANAHGVSVRTVQRLFSSYVGVGPKWVLQRYRLHEAIAQLHAGAQTDWARFSVDLGYYDQAHFLRDFRALVGRTPAEYERAQA